MAHFPLIPDLILPKLTSVNAELLKSRNIGLLLLDFDNTIIPYTTSEPDPETEEWLLSLPSLGIPYAVVSNSRKSRVEIFCRKYDIPCITQARKPFSRGIRQALSVFPHSGKAALVGDQIYTDVLGANCSGVFSVLVSPIHLHNLPLKLRHVLELPFINIGNRRNII